MSRPRASAGRGPAARAGAVAFVILVLAAPRVAVARQAAPEPGQTEPAFDLSAAAADLEQRQQTLDALFAALSDAHGEERQITWDRITRRGRAYTEALESLLAYVDQAPAGDGETGEARELLGSHLAWTSSLIQRQLDESSRLVSERRKQREAQPVDDLFLFEQELARESDTVDRLLGVYDALLDWKAELGFETQTDLGKLRAALGERAEELASRARLVDEQRSELARLLEEATPGQVPDLQKAQQAMGERGAGIVRALRATIDLMEKHGLDTAAHRQALIQATGDVTAAALDRRVLRGLFEEWWQDLATWGRANGRRIALHVATFLGVLLAFKLLARVLSRLVRRAMRASERMPKLLQNLGESLVSNTTLLIGLLVALSHVGVEIGPMLASLGVAGFILGFALQDSLSNFAAGGMILVYQPFDVGDVVEAGGVFGTVKQLTLVSTTIHTFDNQKLIVPNRRIWGDVIRNVTAEPTRRIDLAFHLGHRDDVDQALRLLVEAVEADERILTDPAPIARLHDLSEGRAELILRPWVRTEDYWPVRWDLMESIKRRFDAHGIRFAGQQREIRIHRAEPDEPAG